MNTNKISRHTARQTNPVHLGLKLFIVHCLLLIAPLSWAADYYKVDSNGYLLSSSATSWSCVWDRDTGLIWELKTNDNGLRDKSWTYSWYDPDPATNGGAAGFPNNGSCSGSDCGTYGFTQAVNAQGLCGATNWRMPTRNELHSILDTSASPMLINTAYFVNEEWEYGLTQQFSI